jgi:hypothetical protein
MRIAIERFMAQADDETRYDVVVWQDQIDASSMGSGRKTMLGALSYTLSDGALLNRIDAETFHITAVDKIIRKL